MIAELDDALGEFDWPEIVVLFLESLFERF